MGGTLILLCFACWFAPLQLPAAASAATVRISGTIFTTDANRAQIVWPNARVTLKNLSSNKEISTVSNDLGLYSFSGVPAGEYDLSVTLTGFEPSTKRFELSPGKFRTLDFELVPSKRSESVTVSAAPGGIDTSSSYGGVQTLTASTPKSLVRLNSDFQEALPLLPGVLRGPDGLIPIKGGNANQTTALINNASIGDPFTGQPALHLPTAAVESMRVLSGVASFATCTETFVALSTECPGKCTRPALKTPPTTTRETIRMNRYSLLESFPVAFFISLPFQGLCGRVGSPLACESPQHLQIVNYVVAR